MVNNTVDEEINLTGAINEKVRNNFYQSLISAEIESNNLVISSISTTDYFINYSGHDFRLKPTASLAIDLGYDWGQTIDLIGNPVNGLIWDIGSYEKQ